MPFISGCLPFLSRATRQPASPPAHPPVAPPPTSAAPARQPASPEAERLATASPERRIQTAQHIRHLPFDGVLRQHDQDQLLVGRDLSLSYLKHTLLRQTRALPDLSEEAKETIIIQLYRMTTPGTESETALTKFVLNRVYDCFSFFNRRDPSPRAKERPSPSFESRAKAQHIRLRRLLTHISTSQDQLTVETPHGFRVDSKEEGQYVVVACHMRFYVTTQNGEQHDHTPTEWLT